MTNHVGALAVHSFFNGEGGEADGEVARHVFASSVLRACSFGLTNMRIANDVLPVAFSRN